MQLDDVHSSHGQTGAIDHASNAAVKTNVVQVILAGCHIPAPMPACVRVTFQLANVISKNSLILDDGRAKGC